MEDGCFRRPSTNESTRNSFGGITGRLVLRSAEPVLPADKSPILLFWTRVSKTDTFKSLYRSSLSFLPQRYQCRVALKKEKKKKKKKNKKNLTKFVWNAAPSGCNLENLIRIAPRLRLNVYCLYWMVYFYIYLYFVASVCSTIQFSKYMATFFCVYRVWLKINKVSLCRMFERRKCKLKYVLSALRIQE